MERISCAFSSCDRTILSTTALETGGLCMPCFQKKKQAEHDEYTLKNRIIVNPYEGIENSVDCIKVYNQKREKNSLIVFLEYQGLISDVYKKLSDLEVDQLVSYSVSLVQEGRSEEAKKIIAGLVVFKGANITEFLKVMLDRKDFDPAFLYNKCAASIASSILKIFLQEPQQKDDLFEVMVWLAKRYSDTSSESYKHIREKIESYRRSSIYLVKDKKIKRDECFKKSILGNINIASPQESWPSCEGTYLNPVLQLAIEDLPYRPKEFSDIDYLCVYIHPNDPSALLQRSDALIIKTYHKNEVSFIDVPNSVFQEEKPSLLNFQKFDDYFGYNALLSTKYFVSNNYKNEDVSNIISDFSDEEDGSFHKILGWPTWIQSPEDTEGSTFILQIESAGLWEYSDDSALYIFQNNDTKSFWGFIQMY